MIFASEPEDFNKQADVVACFVEYAGTFLMLLRHPEKPNGGLWGLPAGKVDEDEDRAVAMCRELQEETGIACARSDLRPVRSVLVRHDDFDFGYHMYRLSLPTVPSVLVNAIEHTDHQWFSPQASLTLPQVCDQAECTRLVYGLKVEG